MNKQAEMKVISRICTDSGEYVDIKLLSPDELVRVKSGITETIGKSLSREFIRHPEFVQHCIEYGYILGIKKTV